MARAEGVKERRLKMQQRPKQCGSQRPWWFDFHHEGDGSY